MPFRFKQFYIDDTDCAHKVGTDSVLLGAWADLQMASRVLDIGCGGGLLCLIAAQRSLANIVGVEIDGPSYKQAMQNISNSIFKHRIILVNEDIKDFSSTEGFDAVICNPPFYKEAILPPDETRSRARHTALLPLDILFSKINDLTQHQAKVFIVIPTLLETELNCAAANQGFFVYRKTLVKTKPDKPAKRLLLALSRKVSAVEQTMLTLCDDKGIRTPFYQNLTSDLYL